MNEVYDLNVDDGKNFIANGFVVSTKTGKMKKKHWSLKQIREQADKKQLEAFWNAGEFYVFFANEEVYGPKYVDFDTAQEMCDDLGIATLNEI